MHSIAYVCMFAILGFGYAVACVLIHIVDRYRRFLYPGSSEDWESGKTYELSTFFSSHIF